MLNGFSVGLFGWFNIIKSFNNDEIFVPWVLADLSNMLSLFYPEIGMNGIASGL